MCSCRPYTGPAGQPTLRTDIPYCWTSHTVHRVCRMQGSLARYSAPPAAASLPSLSESAEARVPRPSSQGKDLTPQPPCDAATKASPRPAILASSPCDHNACFTAAIGWGSRSRIAEQIAPGTRRACRHRRLRFGLPFRLGLSAQRARGQQAVQPISCYAGGSLFFMYPVT